MTEANDVPEPVSSRPQDPDDAILTNPEVPEHRRFCLNESCGQPVGRSRDGMAGRAEGFCVSCGTPFSFSPKLMPGELVNDQYEVCGCINFGGLGWIYLAKDQMVGFYVVLKGLINTTDPDDRAAMEEELTVLAQVDHPSIVRVHNYVEHPDQHSDATIGYIVEEYIAGQSLRDLRLADPRPDGGSGPLPLQQVIAYTLEILPALDYLHSRELLYCDLKPDNIIQTVDQPKLVDLGAVRKIGDRHSPVYGTPGYQAPEVGAATYPSVSSDLYTVGRTMAVLSLDLTDFTGTYAEALPERHEVAVFEESESYYRLLRRATDPVPERRFVSVEEMAGQLHGVFREVLADDEGQPHPGLSNLFGPETQTFGAEIGGLNQAPSAPTVQAALALPAPQVDPKDPAAGLLASVTEAEPAQLVPRLRAAPRATAELRLRLARTFIELDDFPAAVQELDELEALIPGDWRVGWYRGVEALAAGRAVQAWAAFDATYDWLPGEAVPKLALGVAAECSGDPAAAARFYERVWRTDRSYVSAAFGLSRTRLACGEREAAIEVLHAVPEGSVHYLAAQVAAIRARLGRPADLTFAGLKSVDERIERLNLDAEPRERLVIDLFSAALDWIRAGRPNGGSGEPASDALIRGRRLSKRDLRFGMESGYRTLARLSAGREERYALVDRANLIRPRTWV